MVERLEEGVLSTHFAVTKTKTGKVLSLLHGEMQASPN